MDQAEAVCPGQPLARNNDHLQQCFTFAVRSITIFSRLSWKWAPDKPGCLKWPE